MWTGPPMWAFAAFVQQWLDTCSFAHQNGMAAAFSP